jgi:hypothetical protein
VPISVAAAAPGGDNLTGRWSCRVEFSRFKSRRETWEETRARLIAETNAWLAEALRHPELDVRIPMVTADSARFPPSLTPAFWDQVLFE